MIALLALAMGVRNATIRKIAVPDLTTTVLTMTLTGLAADSRLAGGDGRGSTRRMLAVAAMLVGALVGALELKTSIVLPLATASVLAAVTGLFYVPAARRAAEAEPGAQQTYGPPWRRAAVQLNRFGGLCRLAECGHVGIARERGQRAALQLAGLRGGDAQLGAGLAHGAGLVTAETEAQLDHVALHLRQLRQNLGDLSVAPLVLGVLLRQTLARSGADRQARSRRRRRQAGRGW